VKATIHPDYHEITVVMTDGSSFQTRSTFGQAGATLRLDIDPKTHPAWTGVQRVVDKGGRVSRFKDRFGALNLGTVTANVAARAGEAAKAGETAKKEPKAAKAKK
jgi:large subunit ribosomal protein L31